MHHEHSALARCGALLCVIAALPAWATTWTVTTATEPAALTTNDCSGTQCATLRGAINASDSGDTIQFDPSLDGATISLTLYSNNLTGFEFGPSAFFIEGKSLTLDASANGLAKGVTIERSVGFATPVFRLLDVDYGSSLTLIGLTLSNGVAQGGASNSGGGALGAGGAIFNQGTLTLRRCTLTGNVAVGGRGGDLTAAAAGAGAGANSNSGNGGDPNGGAAGIEGEAGARGFVTAFGFAGPGGSGGSGAIGDNGYVGGGGGRGGDGGSGGDGGDGLPPYAGGHGGNGGTGGAGGAGSFGGGGASGGAGGNAGAGGSEPGAYPGGDGGNGGDGGAGGNGGFGGGGGSGGAGGAGGAGGGGATFGTTGLSGIPGLNGLGGIGGGNSGFGSGGAGAGMGGAIFNDAGQVDLVDVTLTGNSAIGGDSGNANAGNGSGFGGAIFNFAGQLMIGFATLSGNQVAAGAVGSGGSAVGDDVFSLGDSAVECSAGFNPCPSDGDASLSMNNSVAANGSPDTFNLTVGGFNGGNSIGSGNGNFISSQLAGIGAVNGAGVTDPKLGALSLPLLGGLVDAMLPQPQSPLTDAATSCNDGAGNPVAIDQLGLTRPQGGTCDIGAVELFTDRIFANNFDGTGTPYP